MAEKERIKVVYPHFSEPDVYPAGPAAVKKKVGRGLTFKVHYE